MDVHSIRLNNAINVVYWKLYFTNGRHKFFC